MARPFLAIILSVVLVLASGAITAMRGSAQTGTFMVICSGSGISVVLLDENGEPHETRQVCPDCALGTLTGLLQVPFSLSPEPPSERPRVNAKSPAQITDFTGPVLPRGPPIA